MNRSDIEGYLAEWQTRLGLDHWKIEVKWDKPASEDQDARVEMEDWYDTCTMHLASEWREWNVQKAQAIVVHELLHLVFRDLGGAVEAVHALLGSEAKVLADARFQHEVEGVVERLAQVLAGPS
jgi:hypothetical protein